MAIEQPGVHPQSPENISSSSQKVLFFVDGGEVGEASLQQTLDQASFDKSHIAVTEFFTLEVNTDGQTGRTNRETGNFESLEHVLPTEPNAPDTVVLFLRPQYYFSGGTLNLLQKDLHTQFPEENRPAVIFYADGFEPSEQTRQQYNEFLFANTPDELQQALAHTEKLAQYRGKREESKPVLLSPEQKKAYDASVDLHDWEQKTADPYQSLGHIVEQLIEQKRMHRIVKRHLSGDVFINVDVSVERGDEDKLIVLDVGTGTGGKGGVLPRTGLCRVIGIDISNVLLDQGKERVMAEGKGLRGEEEDTTLSYPALQRLHEEGIIDEPVKDDEYVLQNYLTTEGNMFSIATDIDRILQHWEDYFPGVDKRAFFGERFVKSAEEVYGHMDHPPVPQHKWGVDIDAAVLSWHVFNEVGDAQNAQLVCQQLFSVLSPNGQVMIEIPDPTEEPYKSLLAQYHKEFPEAPAGVLREKKEDGSYYPPRYFPSRDEMITILRSAGFVINPAKDIQPYYIAGQDEQTGEKKVALKELFITAKKPEYDSWSVSDLFRPTPVQIVPVQSVQFPDSE